MESLQEYVDEYRKQLEKGVIQKAYQVLMEYVMGLRTQFSKKYPDFAPGNIYHGYMDMTYFPIFPESLKGRKLKIGIVLIHETVKFEVWLLGYNKQVQKKYWTLFKEGDLKQYRIPFNLKGVDSIMEFTVADNPDFNNLDSLTKQIEKGTLQFVNDVEKFLSGR
jgi:hypothetical protein